MSRLLLAFLKFVLDTLGISLHYLFKNFLVLSSGFLSTFLENVENVLGKEINLETEKTLTLPACVFILYKSLTYV